MIVVSDTGPLNYLILIGHIEILPQLFSHVVIPPAVMEELTRESTPARVRQIMSNLPSWLEIRNPTISERLLTQLGTGEGQAIELARELKADWLLCDDKAARNWAHHFGLRVIGTLGVLKTAEQNGHVDFKDAVARLRMTNFRVSRELLESLGLEPPAKRKRY